MVISTLQFDKGCVPCIWWNNNRRNDVQFTLQPGRRWLCAASGTQSTSLIQQLSQQGRLDMAIDMLMHSGAQPPHVYSALLEECNKKKSRWHAIHIHHHLLKHRVKLSSLRLGNDLLFTLAKCAALNEACQVFHHLTHRTTFSWTALISCYVESGQARQALNLYQKMQEDGVEPNPSTFVSLLKACGHLADLERGRELHYDAQKKGFLSNAFVANTLLFMYGKCGNLVEAENVFIGLVERDVAAWNAMLSTYVKQSQAVKALRLYRQMQGIGVPTDERTFVHALQACSILAEKEELASLSRQSRKLMPLEIIQGFHVDINRKGFSSYEFVGTTLVSVYAKCLQVSSAELVFMVLSKSYSLVSWNALLSAYVEGGYGKKGLQLYMYMQEQGMMPDERTFVSALQACGLLTGKDNGEFASIISLEICKALHADILRTGFISDVFIASTLVTIYGKCGSIKQAECVFVALSQRNYVSWCAMLSAYVDLGNGEEALRLYGLMQEEGITAKQVSILIALQACCILAEKGGVIEGKQLSREELSLLLGQALHADFKELGVPMDGFVGSMLLTLYGKCGSIKEAEEVFDRLSQHDIVCWSTMLLAYVEQGEGDKAIDLFHCARKKQILYDDVAILCLLQACSQTGNMGLSREIHFFVASARLDHVFILVSAIIDAYGSSVGMIDSQAVFDASFQPNLVSHTACLAGYALSGNYQTCLQRLEEMLAVGINLDEVSFLSLLSACNHSGLVDTGIENFQSMQAQHGVIPDLKHYAVMADLLGRAGDFARLKNMLTRMPIEAGVGIWLSVLGACCTHGNVELGKRAYEHAVCVYPKEATIYVSMANIYVNAGLLNSANAVDVCRQRACMRGSTVQAQSH